MGVFTFTIIDQTSEVSQSRLFKAIFLDNHNLLPKVIPQAIKSMELVEGDDSTVVGCVKKTTFVDGKYVKSKLDEIDLEKGTFKYTSFEGDVYGDVLESVTYEGEVKPSGSGSHYKLVGHFHSKGDAVLKEEDVAFRVQGATKSFAVVTQYLIDNPEVYA